MTLRKSFCSALVVCLCCLISFSGVFTIRAEAAVITFPSGGHFLTAAETRQYIGDTLDVTYYTNDGYVTTTASYYRVFDYYFTEHSEAPVGFVSGSDRIWLEYRCQLPGFINNNSYVGFTLNPSYSIYDTDYLYTCYAFTSKFSISSVYTSPSTDWFIGGTLTHFENNSLSDFNNGIKAYLDGDRYGQGNEYMYCSYIPIVHTSSSSFSAYSVNAKFNGNYNSNSYFSFFVMCPYVSTGGFGGSGIITTAPSVTTTTSSFSGGGGSTDLTETNGLIGRVITSISNAVDSLLEGIKGLFVPDDDSLSDWVDDMKDLLSYHLGGLYEAIDLLTDFYDIFQGIQAKQNIHIDSFNVPLAGQQLQLGGWDIPLKVNGMPAVLYEGIAYIFDFLAVMIFLKMCRNKLEIILNPDSEVVQSDR